MGQSSHRSVENIKPYLKSDWITGLTTGNITAWLGIENNVTDLTFIWMTVNRGCDHSRMLLQILQTWKVWYSQLRSKTRSYKWPPNKLLLPSLSIFTLHLPIAIVCFILKLHNWPSIFFSGAYLSCAVIRRRLFNTTQVSMSVDVWYTLEIK